MEFIMLMRDTMVTSLSVELRLPGHLNGYVECIRSITGTTVVVFIFSKS